MWFLSEKISEIIKNIISLCRWKIGSPKHPSIAAGIILSLFLCSDGKLNLLIFPVFSQYSHVLCWCLSNDIAVMEVVVVLDTAYSSNICTNKRCLISWNYTILNSGNPRGPRFSFGLITAKKVWLAREKCVWMWEWQCWALSLIA